MWKRGRKLFEIKKKESLEKRRKKTWGKKKEENPDYVQNLEGNSEEKRKKFTTKKGKFSKKRKYPLIRAWKLWH